jgi:hypothetical protein
MIRPLYEATILLNGSRDNSVHLPSVTAVELYVLKRIHGANESGTDPIINAKKTGKGVNRTDDQERARIGARYNAPGQFGGIAILNGLYGVGNRLPLEYEATTPAEHSDQPLLREDEEIVEMEPDGAISSLPEPHVIEAKSKKTIKSSVLDEG